MIRAAWARLRRRWVFVLAASSIPLSTLLHPPCTGAGCGYCPASGGCVLLPTTLIFIAVVAQSWSRITKRAKAFPQLSTNALSQTQITLRVDYMMRTTNKRRRLTRLIEAHIKKGA